MNNVITLGPYTAELGVTHSYTTTYNTGESTHVYFAGVHGTGNMSFYDSDPYMLEYPYLSMSINGETKFTTDANGMCHGWIVNQYYEVPKNSTITFTVTTKQNRYTCDQSVKLINFLMF